MDKKKIQSPKFFDHTHQVISYAIGLQSFKYRPFRLFQPRNKVKTHRARHSSANSKRL
jgi:hypothetical protein